MARTALPAGADGYFTQFKGEYDNFLLYAPSQGVFGSVLQSGIDREHAGVEFAIEAKPIVGWTFSAATNLGRYIYTSRPKLFLTLDSTAETILDGVTVYQKNFFVPRTPQNNGHNRCEIRKPALLVCVPVCQLCR